MEPQSEMRNVLITLTTVVTFAAGFYYDPVSLKTAIAVGARLNDKSWNEGRSKLVSVYAGDDSCSAIYSCLDCSTARLCKPLGNGSYVQVKTISCQKDKPYCNFQTGTCTHEPNGQCGEIDDSFICLHNSTYPDADCKTYHVCQGAIATKFHCEVPGDVYNPLKQECEASEACGTFKCTDDTYGRFVPHTIYPQYFSLCDENIISVDRCRGEYEMNERTQECEAVCHKEGILQDFDNCTRYFKCERLLLNNESLLSRRHLDCPPNTAYDPLSYICVDLQHHPDPNCVNGGGPPTPPVPTVTPGTTTETTTTPPPPPPSTLTTTTPPP